MILFEYLSPILAMSVNFQKYLQILFYTESGIKYLGFRNRSKKRFTDYTVTKSNKYVGVVNAFYNIFCSTFYPLFNSCQQWDRFCLNYWFYLTAQPLLLFNKYRFVQKYALLFRMSSKWDSETSNQLHHIFPFLTHIWKFIFR